MNDILKLLTSGETVTGLLHKLPPKGFLAEDIFIVHSNFKSFVLKYGTENNLVPLRNPKKDQGYSVHGGLIETCKDLQEVTSSKALGLTRRTDKYEHRTQLEHNTRIFYTEHLDAQRAPPTPLPLQFYDWERINRLVQVRVTKDLRGTCSNVDQLMIDDKVIKFKRKHFHQILAHCDVKLWIQAHTTLDLKDL